MTIKYECNKCGAIMDDESNKSIFYRVPDEKPLAHLCPDCESEVLDFINTVSSRREREEPKPGRLRTYPK